MRRARRRLPEDVAASTNFNRYPIVTVPKDFSEMPAMSDRRWAQSLTDPLRIRPSVISHEP